MSESVSFSFFQGITQPLGKISKYLKEFLILTFSFSMFNSLFSFAVGRNILCNGFGKLEISYCHDGLFAGFLSCMALLCGISFYINRWHMICYDNKSIKEVLSFSYLKKDIKTLGFVLFYIVLWGVVSGGVFFLKTRVATPNWKLELGIFMIVSLLIIFSLLLLLNSVLFSRFMKDKNWVCLNKSLLPILDNFYKVVGWFMVYLLFFMMLFRVSLDLYQIDFFGIVWLKGIIIDFGINLVIYFGGALAVLLLDYQEEIIFDD